MTQRIRADRRREAEGFWSALQTLVHMHRTTGESLIRAPDKFSFNGSGLPIPSKGDAKVSLINRLILFRVFLLNSLNATKGQPLWGSSSTTGCEAPSRM